MFVLMLYCACSVESFQSLTFLEIFLSLVYSVLLFLPLIFALTHRRTVPGRSLFRYSVINSEENTSFEEPANQKLFKFTILNADRLES